MADKSLTPEEQIDRIIDLALIEDTSQGDVTSEALIPAILLGTATIQAKAEGILAGTEVAGRVFFRIDPSLEITVLIPDGSTIKPGDRIATVSGRVISILKAERVMLNFLQRLSGVATLTAQYVSRVEGLPVTIVDTRKTTPGLRMLEKHAVRMGGGENHPVRLHLGDGILIKDNHLAALRALGKNLKDIITKTRQNAPEGMKVEVEVTSVEEAKEAAEVGVDIVMLDNMSPEEMRRAVSQMPEGVKMEASGGINLENVQAVAETGVDIISLGTLTHSAEALDISLELEPETLKLL
ncbi:MAG: carboxylating nicotinate-nucleotide diphosphorylase [Dehalococcoidales bacterium]|nr:MAG: carboxylating nicotinate-nucleotide diphosphorylase [Dehalococcoidales bacterium]